MNLAWDLNNDCNPQLVKSPRHERIMVQSGELSSAALNSRWIGLQWEKSLRLQSFGSCRRCCSKGRGVGEKTARCIFGFRDVLGCEFGKNMLGFEPQHPEYHGLGFGESTPLCVFDLNSAWMIVLLYSFAQDITYQSLINSTLIPEISGDAPDLPSGNLT